METEIGMSAEVSDTPAGRGQAQQGGFSLGGPKKFKLAGTEFRIY